MEACELLKTRKASHQLHVYVADSVRDRLGRAAKYRGIPIRQIALDGILAELDMIERDMRAEQAAKTTARRPAANGFDRGRQIARALLAMQSPLPPGVSRVDQFITYVKGAKDAADKTKRVDAVTAIVAESSRTPAEAEEVMRQLDAQLEREQSNGTQANGAQGNGAAKPSFLFGRPGARP